MFQEGVTYLFIAFSPCYIRISSIHLYKHHLLTRTVGWRDTVRDTLWDIFRSGFLPVTSFRIEDCRDLFQDVADAINQTGLFPVHSPCTENWKNVVLISTPGLFSLAFCAFAGTTLTIWQILQLNWDEHWNEMLSSGLSSLTSMFICQWGNGLCQNAEKIKGKNVWCW